jgi:hypothetical protein
LILLAKILQFFSNSLLNVGLSTYAYVFRSQGFVIQSGHAMKYREIYSQVLIWALRWDTLCQRRLLQPEK